MRHFQMLILRPVSLPSHTRESALGDSPVSYSFLSPFAGKGGYQHTLVLPREVNPSLHRLAKLLYRKALSVFRLCRLHPKALVPSFALISRSPAEDSARAEEATSQRVSVFPLSNLHVKLRELELARRAAAEETGRAPPVLLAAFFKNLTKAEVRAWRAFGESLSVS